MEGKNGPKFTQKQFKTRYIPMPVILPNFIARSNDVQKNCYKKNSKQHISTQHAATTSIIYKHCSHQQHTRRTDHVTLQMVVEFVCKPNSATRRRVRDMLTADIRLAVAAGERASSSLHPRHRRQPRRAESPGDDVSLASVSRDPAAGFQLRYTRTLTDTLLPSNKTVRPR